MSVMARSNAGAISKKRKHEDDAAGPSRKLKRSSEPEEQTSTSEDLSREDSAKPPTKHTKKERKQNRSTRIHSLRKQLARGSLPSTIQQEKERELAALLHEQNKTKSKQESKRTLEKYHYVRFVERQKAEKRLKQLLKQKKAEPEGDELSRKIHEMEVNRNYAMYAPLDQKYISIFAPKLGPSGKQDDSLQDSIVTKPPMWKVVEATMARGQPALEALREGKTRIEGTGQEGATDLDEGNEAESKMTSQGQKHKLNKAHREKTGVRRKETVIAGVEEATDDDMSDGGFFDR
ncbi:rRNA-processing protein efg1 [Knufia obscura]|uniref:rRNA-processing protein EFG1 n=1 Tax=Knufia obscura TaxID=1635080 RepID=A0ABR0RDG2_9EURO|nr:rRNA-processing protein efg1 [Knufia obscura]